MQTVLFISPMELGQEVAVRRVHERFPIAALDGGVGVERLVAFIGSGWYALEITVGDGDFQTGFHRFLAEPAIQEFFAALRPYVQRLPAPDAVTGHLPLATAMVQWQSPAGAEASIV